MNEIINFISISRYAGERFDLVQAGGGNSSVKLNDDTMIIKSSGVTLSEVSETFGYSKVLTHDVADIVKKPQILNAKSKREREKLTSEIMAKATLDKANRPSIETLLHSLLKKYTLHTHPLVVNMICNKVSWREHLNSIFAENILLVDYRTPGIELALELDAEIRRLQNMPDIIFLQNHGLIVTSESANEIINLNNFVIEKIENYLGLNLKKYKMTNQLSDLVSKIDKNHHVTYLSNDKDINDALINHRDLLFKDTFAPDSLVYCGINTVEITDINDTEKIVRHYKQYGSIPKIIVIDNFLYIVSHNLKKAKEIEDVLRFNILVLSQSCNNINYLTSEEVAYLSNWDAEKFRQKR